MTQNGKPSRDPGEQRSEGSKTQLGEVWCTFCGATPREAQKIIAGPNEIYICDGCFTLAPLAAGNGTASNSRTTLLKDSRPEEVAPLKDLVEQLTKLLARVEREAERCSFCRNGFRTLVRPSRAPGITICLECIDLCMEILVEEAEEQRKGTSASTDG